MMVALFVIPEAGLPAISDCDGKPSYPESRGGSLLRKRLLDSGSQGSRAESLMAFGLA